MAIDDGYSRRNFLRRLGAAGLGALAFGAAAGTAEAKNNPPSTGGAAPPLRFVFATDLHLFSQNGAFRSEEGIAACLAAIEALQPRPAFILCGGDLVHELPQLKLTAAEKALARFLQIWKDHTTLPTHFALGNHDLAGTRASGVDRADPRFGKGLFRQRLGMGAEHRDFFRFDAGGWRFVVLDDVALQPDGSYIGEFAADQLSFLRAQLQAPAPPPPTIICGHIPAVSTLPYAIALSRALAGGGLEINHKYVATNTPALEAAFAGANVRAVLSGHLHHQEQSDRGGVRFINAGAVCGNWWRGSFHGCPEGFLLVDLQPDGRMESRYQTYGWKAL